MPTETRHSCGEIRELPQRVTCAKQSEHDLKHQKPYDYIGKVTTEKTLLLTTKTDRSRIRTNAFNL